MRSKEQTKLICVLILIIIFEICMLCIFFEMFWHGMKSNKYIIWTVIGSIGITFWIICLVISIIGIVYEIRHTELEDKEPIDHLIDDE